MKIELCPLDGLTTNLKTAKNIASATCLAVPAIVVNGAMVKCVKFSHV